jgi:hypothetical protein
MGSQYEVDLETAVAIRQRMQDFLKKHPIGMEFTTPVEYRGESQDITATVTAMSRCPDDEKKPCEIELREKQYGGFANITLEIDRKSAIQGRGYLAISGADFPYPAEYIIANKEVGIKVVEDTDWCIIPEGEVVPKHCSKRRW